MITCKNPFKRRELMLRIGNLLQQKKNYEDSEGMFLADWPTSKTWTL